MNNQNWVLMLSRKRMVIAVGLGAWHWMVAQEKNLGKEPLPKAVIVDVTGR